MSGEVEGVDGIVDEAGEAAADAVAAVLQSRIPAIQAGIKSSSQEVLGQLFSLTAGELVPPAPVTPALPEPLPPALPPAAAPLPPVIPAAPPAAGPPPPPPSLPWESDAPLRGAIPSDGAAGVKPAAATIVVPTSGMLKPDNMRNLDNWRASLHQVTPVIVSVFVTLGLTTQDTALLWVSLLFAVADPLLSYANATDKARKIAYGVLGVLQSGGLLAAVLGESSPWVPISASVVTILSSALARFYTPTSTMVPAPSAT